ncbi:hypothetical protein BDB01DRAFT_783372 [Pilobolus umbonatus]|nr:hypothetical protein BDB01DRAFT_783372 [Pilobolus umbonatus]
MVIHKMDTQNIFPSECLQLVSTHLSHSDLSQCMYVCRSWYNTFQRSLYKSVRIYSDEQLQTFMDALILSRSLDTGYYWGCHIKHLYLVHYSSIHQSHFSKYTGLINPSVIYLSQEIFDQITVLCPQLETFIFDISQWGHITLTEFHKPWQNMKSPPPIAVINMDHCFFSVFGTNITTLHITHDPHELQLVISKIGIISSLKHLILNMHFNETNITTTTLAISEYLEAINHALPYLHSLEFRRTSTPLNERPPADENGDALSLFSRKSHLRSLSLHGHIDSIRWFQFISSNYPYLRTLEINKLSASRFGAKWAWQSALIELVKSMPSLRSLSLGGRNIPQLFSNSLARELKSPFCSIDNLYIDFETYQAIESCQFLLVISDHGFRQLTHLRLRVFEDTPGWSGVTKSLFKCKQLISLELYLSKDHNAQFPSTPFLIDCFISNMPQLTSLSLIGANVQVMSTHPNVYYEPNKPCSLKELMLSQCRLQDLQSILYHISRNCSSFRNLVVEQCITCNTENKSHPLLFPTFTIDMPYTRLNRLMINSTMTLMTPNSLPFDYIAIKILHSPHVKTEYEIAWCKFHQKNRNVYHYRYLPKNEDIHNELEKIYNCYMSPYVYSDLMPGNYIPSIGTILVKCQSVTELYIDDYKIHLHPIYIKQI